MTPLTLRFALLLLLIHYLNPYGLTHAQTPQYVPGEIIVKIKDSRFKATRFSAEQNNKFGIASLDALNDSWGVTQIRPLFKLKKTLILQKKAAQLDQVVKITAPNDRDLETIISAYQNDPNVEYAQPNYVHQLHFVPNDSLFEQQRALQILQAPDAWDIQRASPDILVGVIDTGIDYTHEDLRDALWINLGEDLNGNGQVDSSDFNGLDDDGNGFVDDIRGWDFTDAPTFPDGGDFREPDNDPFDENGHGTSVAGIIGATGDNVTGIAGLAFGCQIMNLRAGTSLGFLEEDDVASAIVYAVENGARIINMSFGDQVASPLLRDVMQYAYNQNCVLVASAGNSATDQIHFPSGFSETISVGATDEDDRLAGFSNYGSSVDVVAPGVNILTTKRENQYGSFAGTSASAPFVSALAALILSKTPQLSNESVRGLITSSTDDLGELGWDNFFASGRINASKALRSPYFSTALIIHPEVDQGFASGPVAIRGTAAGTFLQEYIVEYGVGETPETWTELFREKNRQIIDEPITELDIGSLADTVYTLRLIVQNKNGTAVEDKVRFFIDRTPPVISNVRQTPMIDADRHSFLLEFDTDDLGDAAIYFRPQGSTVDFEVKKLRFRTTTHRINFTQDLFTGNLEYFIEAVNGSGLTSVNDNQGDFFKADLSALPIGGAAFEKLPTSFPSGLLLGKTSDFDRDGLREVVLNQYGENFTFGPLKILEFNQDQFQEVYATQQVFIPRDWGDSDGDGLLELFVGAGPRSYIFEAPAPNEFPTQIVWADSNDVWASRFADLDRDGQGEIIVRVGELFTVWETVGDNAYALVDSFPNSTEGSNSVGVPHSEVGDFDGDGQLEILFGDFDGDVYLYENRGDDRYEFTWSDRLPLIDTIDFLTVGDYDGDGVTEFVVGSHSDPSLNTESTFDSRHWLYRVYKTQADNSFRVVWEQAFFGFQSPADFDSGVASGDVDNDGRAEILINVFPDFYVVDFDPAFADYKVTWHTSPNRSNSTIVDDFDKNGLNEFYFNTGEEVVGYQIFSDFGGPPPPLAFKARPLDTNLVELTWQPAGSVDGFQIYRGTSSLNLTPLIQVANPPFLDSTVVADIEYWYSVTSIDSAFSPVESLPTPVVKVKPGAKPYLVSAVYFQPDQVQLRFSEPMDRSVKNQTNFEIEGVGTPTSAVVHRSGQEVILTSPASLEPGTYKVTVQNVSDLDGTPVDTLRDSATFRVEAQEKAPYLVNATLVGQNQLLLEFNEPMDAMSVSRVENYVIEPNISVAEASLSSEDPKIVILQIASSSPIGPFGIDYFITVRNVKSQQGVAIKFGQGDTAALIFSSPDLSHVFAYPNPYRGDSGRDYVTIAGLTRQATVKILDVSGRILRTLQETDGNGGVQWDLRDESGNPVASGIYVFYVVGEGKRAVGKLAVVR
jgi:subtilisin family serine protease/methionine-rich copper-binding protein CopC